MLASWFRVVIVAVTTVVAVAAAAPAQAAPPSSPRVAVLPIAFEGERAPDAHVVLHDQLLEGMKGPQLEIVSEDRVAAGLGKRTACTDRDCFTAVAKATDVAFVVRTEVTVRDRVFQISLTLIDASTGEPVADTGEICELCGVQEVGEMVFDEASALRERLVGLVSGQPALVVTSAPSGATVMLDGRPFGVTPLDRGLPAGKHVVRIEHEGFVAEEREVLAVKGGRETVSVDLVPVSVAHGRRRRMLLGFGGASLGLGVALVATGVPLIIIDDRQNKRRCSGDDVDINGTCRHSYDTLAGGITALVSGVVLSAVGAGLLGVARKERRTGEVQAYITPRSIGVTGRF